MLSLNTGQLAVCTASVSSSIQWGQGRLDERWSVQCPVRYLVGSSCRGRSHVGTFLLQVGALPPGSQSTASVSPDCVGTRDCSRGDAASPDLLGGVGPAVMPTTCQAQPHPHVQVPISCDKPQGAPSNRCLINHLSPSQAYPLTGSKLTLHHCLIVAKFH